MFANNQSPLPQQQHQQHQQQQQNAGTSNPSGSSQMSAEQYHLMMLQYQLQQSQAHAQAQAQLLALYQQQQQQQQLQSAASAYHQALAQSARSQAAVPYGLPPQGGGQAPHLPNMPMPPQQGGPNPYAGLNLPGFANTMPLAPAAAPTPHAMPPSAAPISGGSSAAPSNPTDARIHSNLATTPNVEWVPLPPRYVMDSVAKTAAAAKVATLRKEAVAAGTIAEGDEAAQLPSRPTKTVFVGGISYDVARDARVLPWLAASMCSKKPVVVRKVIPHKERKAKSDSGVSPKLALSAFVVVDGDEAEALVEALHHRVMWDIGGCWIAKSPEGVEALRDYANAQCTWQRREQGAASGLPRHMMTVEAATAMGSHDKPAGASAVNAKRSSAMTTTNFGHNDCVDLGAGAPPPAVGFNPAQAILPTPAEHNNSALRFDWGVEPSVTTGTPARDGFAAITKSPSARSPSATASNASSGNIGER